MSNQQNQTISCECFCLRAFVDDAFVALKTGGTVSKERHHKGANFPTEITPLIIAKILFLTLNTSFTFVLNNNARTVILIDTQKEGNALHCLTAVKSRR